MSIGPHHEGEPHDHDASLGEVQVRVRALETILVAKGYVDPAALDALIDTYETRVGPRNGARVVARAWSDAIYRRWLAAPAQGQVPYRRRRKIPVARAG